MSKVTKTNTDQPLMIAEMHNVVCDHLAKQFIQTSTLQCTMLVHPEFKAVQPHLLIDGQVICHHVIPALQQAVAAPEYWEYVCKQFHWMQADLNGIQWTALASALHLFQHNDQWQIILFIHDKLPLCTSKFHSHHGSHLCPLCQHLSEDKCHFLQCQHQERCQQFEKLWVQLISLSLKHALHPGILTAYWISILLIHNNMPYPNVLNDIPPELWDMVCYQAWLGGDQLSMVILIMGWKSMMSQSIWFWIPWMTITVL